MVVCDSTAATVTTSCVVCTIFFKGEGSNALAGQEWRGGGGGGVERWWREIMNVWWGGGWKSGGLEELGGGGREVEN